MVANLINKNGRAVANQFVITEGNGDIAFQSYNSRVCEIRKGGLGFERVVVLGKDYNYSQTTTKHLYSFLSQNGLEILANKKAIDEALKRGHARYNEAVAVWYDETMR